MNIGPVDRRGLAEIVAWAGALFSLLVLALAQLVRNGAVDPMVLSTFMGTITALLARGTKAAMDRSAAADAQQQPPAPSEKPPS